MESHTHYLKTIFFLHKNYTNALKLMTLLWDTPNNFNNIEIQIAIGLLLGYLHKNIITFIYRNYSENINNEIIKKVINKLNKLKVSLDKLNKVNKIVYLHSIPKL